VDLEFFFQSRTRGYLGPLIPIDALNISHRGEKAFNHLVAEGDEGAREVAPQVRIPLLVHAQLGLVFVSV
jgi:hypothetical protein